MGVHRSAFAACMFAIRKDEKHCVEGLGLVVADEVESRVAFVSRNPREHYQGTLFASGNGDSSQKTSESFASGF